MHLLREWQVQELHDASGHHAVGMITLNLSGRACVQETARLCFSSVAGHDQAPLTSRFKLLRPRQQAEAHRPPAQVCLLQPAQREGEGDRGGLGGVLSFARWKEPVPPGPWFGDGICKDRRGMPCTWVADRRMPLTLQLQLQGICCLPGCSVSVPQKTKRRHDTANQQRSRLLPSLQAPADKGHRY